MKHILTLLTTLAIAAQLLAQKPQEDSLPPRQKSDTIKIGKLILITKRDKKGAPNKVEIKNDTIKVDSNAYSSKAKKKRSNVSTKYFDFDLGFNNYTDNTNYGSVVANNILKATSNRAAPNQSSFDLNTGKSINFNLWIFNQKVNIIQHKLNFKYGLGIEIFNFRYNSNLTFNKTNPTTIITDSINFNKNKLTVKYLTIPLMLTLNPSGKKSGFSISAGASISYRYGAHTKQKSDERGKQKQRDDYDLNPLKLALVGDIGYKWLRLYTSVALTPLHQRGLELTPYTVGFRFSKW